MLEYVFFEEAPRKRFQDFLAAQGLAWTLEPGTLETLVVVDEAGLDDELAERIESVYDELFALEQAVHSPRPAAPAEVDDDDDSVTIRIPDGRTLHTDLPQELVHRVLTVITAEELALLAEVIARAVERLEAEDD
jgi:hypothetical protein